MTDDARDTRDSRAPIAGTVLVVDDDPDIVSLFASTLEPHHTVRRARDGHEALEVLTDDVDVVLLDRDIPGLHGDDVLRRIRARGCGCHVAMVTAIPPELDLVDLDVDDYVVKPILPAELLELVERLLRRDQHGDDVDEFLSVTSRRATLEGSVDRDELETDEAYQELVETFDVLRESNRDLIEALHDRVLPRRLWCPFLKGDEDE